MEEKIKEKAVETGTEKQTAEFQRTVADDGTIQLNFSTGAEKNEKPIENEEPIAADKQAESENDSAAEPGENLEEFFLEEVETAEGEGQTGSEEKEEKEEESLKEEVEEEVKLELPENIQDLVKFLQETKGTLEDYVKLNKDYSKADEKQLLREFYKATKPNLDDSDIDFLIDDSFSFDEETDDDIDIKRKKLSFKQEVQAAKDYLEDIKDKYYKEIKASSGLSPEQKKAVDFFNRHNEEIEDNKKKEDAFLKETDKFFNESFKGFEYEIGEKKYRFNVRDVNEVKSTQGDINNFVKKFLTKEGVIDQNAYHKALYAGMHSDAIAKHFYQQGKADAIKESAAKGKNIDMDPRQGNQGTVKVDGMSVRAVSGDDSSKLRIKVKS